MTTPRPHARTRRAAASIVVTAAGLLALAGCDPRTVLYFLQPFEPTVPAPGPISDRLPIESRRDSTTWGSLW